MRAQELRAGDSGEPSCDAQGIALVIPIREGMERPELFPHMLVGATPFQRCCASGPPVFPCPQTKTET